MKKIAIIGAGISGLFFANLLKNNSNYDFTIFEKKKLIDLEDGYGIQLSVNSIKLLNQIGFKDIDKNHIRNSIAEAENELSKDEIDDQKRFILNHKVEVLKSISTN